MPDRFQLGEFWLARRSDQTSAHWQITWFDRERRQTRQRSTGTGDFERAKILLAEHYVRAGARRDEPAHSVLIDHVLSRYYDQHAKSLRSAEISAYAIERWRAFWGDRTVAQMSYAELERFQGWLAIGKRGNASAATVNRVLAVGRAALERARRRQEIQTVPAIPGMTVSRPRLYRAGTTEVARLLNATENLPHVRRWLVGTLVTLGRPEAVLQLSRPQLNFDLRRIDLNPPGRTQNDKRRPIVPMTQTAYGWLSGDWTGLWITYRGRPLGSIRQGFERARGRAGLPATITPYTLRRTLSTELRRRGIAPWEIAGYLGHSVREYAITEGYAEYAPDYLSAASLELDAYCAELQPLLDFDLLRTSHVPPQSSKEVQSARKPLSIIDNSGRREWDRTTDHFHVNELIPPKKQGHK